MNKICIFCYLLMFFSFKIYAQGPFTLYYGNIHSHTDYSGGVGVPIQAFAYANNNSDLDVLAITDHLESIYYSSFEWDSIKISATLATVNGQFVGLAGYEWTSPTFNHVNVFNTTGMTSPLNVNNWDGFLTDLQNQPNAIAQFNHPGLLGTNNWNNLAYKTAAIDSVFRLIEVKKWSDDVYYQMALNAGWHVSATNNQDNHEWDWGTMDDTRTGIYAQSLTTAGIIEALYARRTFSTEDKNATVWMEYNGHAMGGFSVTEGNASLRIKLSDEDGETWNTVDVVGSNGTLVFTHSFPYSSVDTTILINTNGLSWVFIRAKQNDDNYLWSAPVFLTPGSFVETIKNENSNLMVYPNPAQQEFFCTITNNNSSQIHFLLSDLAGRTIHSENHTSSTFKIDISDMEAGIYNISVETEKGKLYSKLIIAR